ncbi:steryl-sulfatase-like [Sycon ciliatum]|uniref:steryl-sulfatase-like n=1 Tax=Sycon ciliatum TaxID=27933 RepID=UPI0031F66A1B
MAAWKERRATALLLAFVLLDTSSYAMAAPGGRPNFIHLMMDDWGWGDVGVYKSPGGGYTRVQTPNIDSLARSGKMFTDYHSTSPVCSPSRAGIMTGRFPGEIGIHSALSPSSQKNREEGNVDFLDPSLPSVSATLQQHGYVVGHFGKWHLGSTETPVAAPLPSAYGINSSFTFDSRDPNQFNTSAQEWPSMSSGMIVDKAVEFMTDATHKKLPFYMNVWLHVSHAKLDPTRQQMEKYLPVSKVCRLPSTNETTCPHLIFWASQTNADEQVGRLVDSLHSLDLVKDTLLVFTTDNGPEDPAVYMNAVGSAGPFRGQKRSLYEGGHRLPFIAHMPGTIPSNVVDHSVISGADWFPTVATMAGVELPASVTSSLSGVDISHVLVSNATVTTRSAPLLWDWQINVTGPCWNRAPNMAIRVGPYKLLQNPDLSRVELYNLDAVTADHKGEYFEAQNVADDLDMQATRTRLSATAMGWWNKLPNTTTHYMTGCEAFPLPVEGN